MSGTEYPSGGAVVVPPRRANGWPVLPMRLFLAALFMFAGYAKLSYPGFFDPNSVSGLKASVDAVKHGTPIGGALGPLADHPSLFGHITAFAEIAIGLGLLVGLLTRIAALGGMVLTVMIALSIDWGGIKQYTGSSGWFTSVDFAVAAALSVFLIGGADPFSLDGLIWRSRVRRRALDDAEPGFRDNELEDSRRRLQGEPSGYAEPVSRRQETVERDQYGAAGHQPYPERAAEANQTQQLPTRGQVQPTEQLPTVERDEDATSLWNSGRRDANDREANDREANDRDANDRDANDRDASESRPKDRPADPESRDS
ncbi:MAG: TQO small subunit DoxD [Jatrophihabitantaceae bacterium]